MRHLWSFIRDEHNRQVLSWIGAGVAALAVACWTFFTWVWSPHPESGTTITCVSGSIEHSWFAHDNSFHSGDQHCGPAAK